MIVMRREGLDVFDPERRGEKMFFLLFCCFCY